MRDRPLFAICLLVSASLFAPAGHAVPGHAQFPAEVRGVWDAYPLTCVDDGPSDSDMRIRITPRVLHAYENNDTVRSITRISESPLAWRVVTISDIAPEEIQGEADIYVLRGDALTITNGERAYTYRRCR